MNDAFTDTFMGKMFTFKLSQCQCTRSMTQSINVLDGVILQPRFQDPLSSSREKEETLGIKLIIYKITFIILCKEVLKW